MLNQAAALRVAIADEPVPPGRIAFVRDGDVWVWSDGNADRLFEHGSASDPRWSPDGRQVLYVQVGNGYSDLRLRNLDDGSDSALTFNEPQAEPGSELYAQLSSWVRDPSWSPSGMIAFAADYNPAGVMQLWLMSSPGATATIAPDASTGGSIEGVCLSTGGTLAAYTVQMTDGIEFWTEVVLRDLTDGVAYLLADDAGGPYDPAIAPDEQTVVFSLRDAAGVSDLWLIERATGARRQLTFGAQAASAVWSPDGSWLAYLRPNDDDFELWALPMADGVPGAPILLDSWGGVDATSGLSWTLAS